MQDVKIYGLQHRARSERTKRPWIVRWSVEGPQHSRSFRTRVEADRFRSFLVEAQRRGEPFAIDSGEPESWEPRAGDVRCHEWARRWLAEHWDEWQPRTRASAVEALARFV
ncbi:MAG: site-specific integrase, partial [Acidimicrobiales bacterium]